MSAGRKCVSETTEAQEMAINTLKEIQQYRAIGTPEEFRNCVLEIPKAYNKGIDDLVERLKDYFVIPHDVMVIEQFAKQLKKGEEND